MATIEYNNTSIKIGGANISLEGHTHPNEHTHTNQSLLDSLVGNGGGTQFLANDGTYKTINNVTDQNILTGVGQLKFWTGTQTEYDAIGTKDNATLYIIK